MTVPEGGNSAAYRLRRVRFDRHTLMRAAALLLFALWAAPVLGSLVARWIEAPFAHGAPIVGMTGVLLYLELRRGPPAPGRGSMWGVAALALCLVPSTVAEVAGIVIVPQSLLPVATLSMLGALFGFGIVRRLWAPLFFIYFAIPFWQVLEYLPGNYFDLNEALRLLTTWIVTSLIDMTAIPAFIEGNFIHIPSGTFEIAEGCSGRGFFIVAVELSLFYGIAFLASWRQRIVAMLAAAGVSLIGNWLRVYLLVLIGYWSEMQSPLVASHGTFGWAIFVLVLLPMLIVFRYLEAMGGAPAADTGSASRRIADRAHGMPSAFVIVLLAASIWLDYRVAAVYAVEPVTTRIQLPQLGAWEIAGAWEEPQRPYFPGAAEHASARYERNGERVAAYVASFPVQKQGREVVYHANRLVPEGERLGTERLVSVRGAGGARFRFMERPVTSDGRQRLLWLGVRVAGRQPLGRLSSKWYQVVGFFENRADAQVVAFSADCEPDCRTAARRLEEFAAIGSAGLYRAAVASIVRPAPAAE